MSSSTETRLHYDELVASMNDGDVAARDVLFAWAAGRLERRARRELRAFTRLRRYVETADVLQEAMIRLIRALDRHRPNDARHFLNLAGRQIGWELCELYRTHFGRGLGGRHASDATDDARPPIYERAAVDPEVALRLAWHEFTERLPADEREVLELRCYCGLSSAAISAHLGVPLRTVQKRYADAQRKIYRWIHPSTGD